jgi:hypothetical protein
MVAKSYTILKFHALHKLFIMNITKLNYEMTRHSVPFVSRIVGKKVSVHALQYQQTLTAYTECVCNKFKIDPYSGM